MVSLMIIGGSTSDDKDNTISAGVGDHMIEKKDEIEDRPEGKNIDAEESHVFAISSATILFQALMILTSIYYAMICTNWGQLSLYTGMEVEPDNTAFWLKMVSQWITMFLYLLSLLAPVLFPNRDFD